MTLQPGATLGPYEVVAPIGAGGMGEVYRARDTRLKRDVALKVLPDAFSHDPDRLARFQREAELLATLNHPNIAAVYGLEQAVGISAIVLELVEGETLTDLIARGPISIADALPIARQIADALEAAHEKGVIHRDLKPGNIKVTAEGRVKVLDFGLAKILESEPAASALSMSPTLSVHATQAGVILGTAAYMSPEQARGKRVDRRADIWAFGCVLFEMLTGRQAFDPGETVSDAIAAVLTKEPDWAALPDNVPAAIRTLLRRCLQKDPQKRLPHIGLARIEIDEGEVTPVPGGATGPASAVVRPAAWRSLPWAMAGVLGVGLASVVVALWAPWREAPASLPQRLSVELGADVSLATGQGAAAILSPDGQTLAFVAQASPGSRSQLYVRRLDQLQAEMLNGTEGAGSPFFSPDGQWIGFFAEDKLKKISVTGGAAVTLADAPTSRGGVWAEDGTVTFQPIGIGQEAMPLMRVPSAGGTPEPLTAVAEGEITHRWPEVLPSGRAVLFTAHSSTSAGYEDANIVVQTLPAGPRKIVHRGGYHARYLPSGHLVYMHEGTLFAAPFDVNRLELTAAPIPVLEQVASNPFSGGAQFAVSRTGTLAYLPGQNAGRASVPIFWMDRQGKTTPLRATPSDWDTPQFSPDGRLLAISAVNRVAGGADTIWEDVWVYDWMRDTLSRLTFDPTNDGNPVWTPDGQRIVFSSERHGKIPNLYWQRADGTGAVQRLTESQNPQLPASWHPSGKFLAFQEIANRNDVMILTMEGDEVSGWKPGKPTVFLNSPFNETQPMFSPDGRWLAYVSNESGQADVYVRPFPGPGGKWQISTGGGEFPAWSRTARELFYRAPDGRIMVSSYAVDGDAFRPDKPRVVAETRTAEGPRRPYDVHPDGQRFAIAPVAEETPVKQDKVIFIFNFFDELRRIAPVP